MVPDEGFSQLMMKAGTVKSFEVVPDGLVILHLQFANGSLSFFNVDIRECLRVKVISRCFVVVLGLRVNLRNGVLVGFGVEDEDLVSVVLDLGSGIGELLMISWAFLARPCG